MPALQELSATLIHDQIVRAVVDVFKTMLNEPIALKVPHGEAEHSWPPYSVPHEPKPHVVGMVGFLGDINGLIYIYLEEQFASYCTGKLLGMSGPELKAAGQEPINDAVGELTNMIVGVFKNGLCDCGYSCKLTIPSIMRGSDFYVDAKRPARRHLFIFESQGRRIIADILMKNDE